MNYQYLDFSSKEKLIDGIVLRRLEIHKDPTGSLVETLRSDWSDVYNQKDLNFAMQYMSITPPAIARDEDKWHTHQNQKDRFICVEGRIVTACFDPRGNS